MSDEESELSNEAVREEVLAWLAENWDPELSVDDWWEIVAKGGWTAPHFTPEQGGRGMHRTAVIAVREAFNEFGALRAPGGMGLLMAGPTIQTHGTPDQIARHLPPILNGQVNWCQLFSEPGAGSDLAGLTTRAERDGDQWILNGQKVWSSMAMNAQYGMLLARTDFNATKHHGISWFAFALDQPGVTIRPLREMTGEAVFNEVFLDNAVVDHADLIGGEGNGWAVTQTTLYFERSGIGAGGAMAGFPAAGAKGGALGRRAGDAVQDVAPTGMAMTKIDDLIALAKSTGRNTDPLIRQRIAEVYTYATLGQWNAERAKAEMAKGGGQAIANLGKLAQTRITKGGARLAVDMLGSDGMLASPDGTEGGRYSNALVFSCASSIYGGTDEIQKNIIAERTLGLPREPMVGKGEPYGEVLRSIAQPR